MYIFHAKKKRLNNILKLLETEFMPDKSMRNQHPIIAFLKRYTALSDARGH